MVLAINIKDNLVDGKPAPNATIGRIADMRLCARSLSALANVVILVPVSWTLPSRNSLREHVSAKPAITLRRSHWQAKRKMPPSFIMILPHLQGSPPTNTES